MISGVGSFNPDHRAPGSVADCPPDFGSFVLPEYDSVPDFKTPEGSHGRRWVNALIRDDQSGYHDEGDHAPSDTGDGLEFRSSVDFVLTCSLSLRKRFGKQRVERNGRS